MRRLLIGFGIFVVVVVAALLVFAATFNVNKYHDTIQSELEKNLGRKTTLGDMHLSLFPPRFRVQDPAIADDPHFSPRPALCEGAGTRCLSEADALAA